MDDAFDRQSRKVTEYSHRRIIREVNRNLDKYVKWPKRAELLWEGCIRVKYHTYPEKVLGYLSQLGRPINALSNGPAIMVYLIAGGERPKWNGRHEWTIHHLY